MSCIKQQESHQPTILDPFQLLTLQRPLLQHTTTIEVEAMLYGPEKKWKKHVSLKKNMWKNTKNCAAKQDGF